MSKETIGTPEQYAEFKAALEELKSVPGPVMKAMQKAQDIYGYLPIEVQSEIGKTFGVPLEEVYGILRAVQPSTERQVHDRRMPRYGLLRKRIGRRA